MSRSDDRGDLINDVVVCLFEDILNVEELRTDRRVGVSALMSANQAALGVAGELIFLEPLVVSL